MKERNLLVFVTALIVTILFVISIALRFFIWYDVNDYGTYVSVPTVYFFIPMLVLWLGWYLNDVKSSLVGSIILTVILFFHIENVGILSGTPAIVSSYVAMVKTIYVLNLFLIIISIVSGFVSYYLPKFTTNEK